MPTPGKYPLALDYEELKANIAALYTWVNAVANTPNINLVGNDIETLADLKVQVIDLATAAANLMTFETKAQADAAMPLPANQMVQVVGDTTPANNGYWYSDGSALVWSEIQPASVASLVALASEVITAQNTADAAQAAADALDLRATLNLTLSTSDNVAYTASAPGVDASVSLRSYRAPWVTTCGDNPTLQINDTGPFPLQDFAGNALQAGDLVQGRRYEFVKIGNMWRLTNGTLGGQPIRRSEIDALQSGLTSTTAAAAAADAKAVAAQGTADTANAKADSLDLRALLNLTLSTTDNVAYTATATGVDASVSLRSYRAPWPSTCGASPTLQINSTGPFPLQDMAGSALQAGDLVSGRRYDFFKIGNAWRVMGTLGANSIRRSEVDTLISQSSALDVRATLAISSPTTEDNINYTATVPNVDASVSLRRYSVTWPSTCADSPTLTMNGVGPFPLQDFAGGAIKAGGLSPTRRYEFVKLGNAWRVLGTLGARPIYRSEVDDLELRRTKLVVNITSSSDNYVAESDLPATSTVEGMVVLFTPNVDNTGPCNLNLDGIGLRAIQRPDGTPTQDGDLLAGRTVMLRSFGSGAALTWRILTWFERKSQVYLFDEFTSSSTNFVVAASQQISRYYDGLMAIIVPNASNTGATCSINAGQAQRAVLRPDGSPLQAGDVVAGRPYIVTLRQGPGDTALRWRLMTQYDVSPPGPVSGSFYRDVEIGQAVQDAWTLQAFALPTFKYNDATGVALCSVSHLQAFDAHSPARTSPTTTFYVSLDGDDGNDGLSLETAVATFEQALTLGNATAAPFMIIADAGGGTALFGEGHYFNGVAPEYDCVILAQNGVVVVGPFVESYVATADTTPGVYVIPRGDISRVVDLNRPEPLCPGACVSLNRLSNIAAVRALTGDQSGYSFDSGDLYVRLPDGVEPTPANCRLFVSQVNNLHLTTRQSTLIDTFPGARLELQGGKGLSTGYGAGPGVGVDEKCIAMGPNVRPLYAGGYADSSGTATAANAVSINGLNGLFYAYGTRAGCSRVDVWNFHRLTVGTKMHVICVMVEGWNAGVGDQANSSNCITGHDSQLMLIEVGGVFRNARGGTIGHNGNFICQHVGSKASGDRGDVSGKANVKLGDNATGYFDALDIEPIDGEPAIRVTGTAQAFVRNMRPSLYPANTQDY